MKLSDLKLHLTGQNKFNMESPPINERDFVSLINEHSRIINKVSYFYATDKVSFDDLRQEIYLNIWLGINQFRGESEMSTWIYRVAFPNAWAHNRFGFWAMAVTLVIAVVYGIIHILPQYIRLFRELDSIKE